MTILAIIALIILFLLFPEIGCFVLVAMAFVGLLCFIF